MAHDCVERRLATEFAEIDLTITDFDVLHYLHSHSSDVVRIGSIQESVALSQPALSRLSPPRRSRFGSSLRQRSRRTGDSGDPVRCWSGPHLASNRRAQRNHSCRSNHPIHTPGTRSAPSRPLSHHSLSAPSLADSSRILRFNPPNLHRTVVLSSTRINRYTIN